MLTKEEILQNEEISNIEKGNLLEKEGYFDEAEKMYTTEILKCEKWFEGIKEEIRKRQLLVVGLYDDFEIENWGKFNFNSIDETLRLFMPEIARAVGTLIKDKSFKSKCVFWRKDRIEEALFYLGVLSEKKQKFDEASMFYKVLCSVITLKLFLCNWNFQCAFGKDSSSLGGSWISKDYVEEKAKYSVKFMSNEGQRLPLNLREIEYFLSLGFLGATQVFRIEKKFELAQESLDKIGVGLFDGRVGVTGTPPDDWQIYSLVILSQIIILEKLGMEKEVAKIDTNIITKIAKETMWNLTEVSKNYDFGKNKNRSIYRA